MPPIPPTPVTAEELQTLSTKAIAAKDVAYCKCSLTHATAAAERGGQDENITRQLANSATSLRNITLLTRINQF